MSKEEFLKIQKCVLKVNIHCDGCRQKVKKILQKIDGVFKTEIDAEQGKVTVSGNVEPAFLIKKLAKSGKHAELWPSQNPNHGNQMKNLQILNTGNALPKPSKGVNEQTKNGGNAQQVQQQLKQLEQIRGLQDLKLPPPIQNLKQPSKDQNPNQKSNKFDLQEDDDDDYFSDDDDLDDYDDEDYEDEEEDDDIEEEVQIPQKGGKGKKDGKNENGGQKAGGISSQNQAGAVGKNGSEAGGAKMGNNGGGAFNNKVNIDIKNGVPAMTNGFQTLGAPHAGRVGKNPTVQRLPATAMNGGGGGYLHSSGPESMAGNPYNQQQYMAAMMNQQRAMANQPMMYARPAAAVNYMPAYSFSTPAIPPADPYTHYFSDENTSSCNVM